MVRNLLSWKLPRLSYDSVSLPCLQRLMLPMWIGKVGSGISSRQVALRPFVGCVG